MKQILATLLALGTASAAAQAPVADVSSGSLEQRIATLERLVKARNSSQRTIQIQLDEMQDEVNDLRGTVETHNHKLEQILQRQRELYLEIDKRIESALVPKETPVAVVSDTTSDETYVLAAGEGEAYDRAVNLILKDKEYDKAIIELQAFVQQFPDSSYGANAHYWLGQMFFIKKEWKQADEHFSRVVSAYVDSNKRPDSLLKLGTIAQNQGNLARAKQLFTQIQSEYPNSSARKLADSRLQDLN